MARKVYIGVPSYKVVIERNMTYSSGNTWEWGTNTSNEVNWKKGETYVCDVTIDGVTYKNLTFSPDVGASWYAVYPEPGDVAFEVYVATINQFYDYSLGLDTTTSHTILLSTGDFKGTARKVKNIYVGVNDIARRIKAAYIGIGGVARPCFGTGLYKYGEITSLSGLKCRLAATTVGDHALFGGGEDRLTFGGSSLTYSATVDAYQKGSLTKSTPTALSVARSRLAATTVGDHALFGGGCSSTGGVHDENYSYTPHSTVDAYQKGSLTRSNPSSSLRYTVYALAATTVGDYALFGGGRSASAGISAVDAYQKGSLTRSNPPSSLRANNCELAATTVGDYALFGGGSPKPGDQGGSNSVDAYQKGSLTRSTPTSLSVGRTRVIAFSIGDYAVFLGGESYNSSTGKNDGFSTVDVYHKDSLTRSNPVILETSKGSRAAATVLGDYALLGPFSSSSTSSTNIEVIDKSFTYVQFYNKAAALKGAATTLEDYALFAGGISGGESQDAVMAIALY